MKKSLIVTILLAIAICFLVSSCRPGYVFKDSKWFWVSWDEAVGKRYQYVEYADAESFRKLSDRDYAVDKKSVFYHNQWIRNADPATFQRIAKYYSRDAKRVFFVEKEIKGADPQTFKPYDKYPWARDKNDAYVGTTALNVRDISTFTLLEGGWAKDSKAYYANSGLLAYKTVPCDYETFVVLNGSYAKDKDRGYWDGIPVEGSDGATFKAQSEFIASDKNHLYGGPNARK